jgi:hypothetical protein
MRVGLTSEGRGVFGETARGSGREAAGLLGSMSFGWDRVRVRLNGELVPVGVVGRSPDIEGREDCKLGLGMLLGLGENEEPGASSRRGE